mmetsp:Transcript_4368/g.12600  ORF Transcript_4368/g.12600 Transcript_4368/m.12600 type:complete len:420 (-) Transcript_4368:1542-2801(-)
MVMPEGWSPPRRRRRRLLLTTAMEEKAIMPPAAAGLRDRSKAGSRAPAARGMPTRLYASAHPRFCLILPTVALPRSRASMNCPRRLPISTTEAAWAAASIPPWSATPTCAAASAGASFTPSPTTATCRPSARRRSTISTLPSGRCPPHANVSGMPTSRATAAAAAGLSPDTSSTRMPLCCSCFTTDTASGRKLSRKPRLPMMPRPSTPTYTTVSELAALLSLMRSAAEGAMCWADDTTPCTHSRRPTATARPSTKPRTPSPASVCAPSSCKSGSPWCCAAERTASATGWRVQLSTAAANCSTSASLAPPKVWLLVSCMRPWVRVPVLSSTTVSTAAAASRTSPPLSSRPRRAPAADATSTAVGVARPRAQGQATTSTSTASLTARARAPPSASSMTSGNTAAPPRVQKAKVAAAAAMTV